MKIHYHPDTHSLWIILADRPSAETEEVAPGVQLDFDAEGRVVAMEILDATGVDLSLLEVSGLEAPAAQSGRS